MNRSHTRQLNRGEIQRLLAQQGLFKGVDTASIHQLAEKVHLLDLDKGEILLQQDQVLDEIYVIVKGSLKAYLLSCSGHQRVIQLLRKGDTIGKALLITRKPSLIFVEALSGSRVLVVPGQEMMALMASCNQVAISMVRALSSQVQLLMTDLEGCCLQNALQRIAQYLCTLSCTINDAKREIELPAPKLVIASLLNLSPETLSRGFSQLTETGYISIKGRLIQLHDLDGLKAVATGAAGMA